MDENSVQNTVFHFRLEIHKCCVCNDMAFCDCACHFRLEVSDFGAVFGLEWPRMGLGERSAGEETPPGASVNCG